MSTILKVNQKMSDAEWQVRCDLAACYRLFVKFGWTDLIFTHLTARVPGHENQYLINPYGLLFEEITASNLLKVDFDGKVISGDYPYNDAGHYIHTAVFKARSDINVLLHSHTRAGIAVSCMKMGLLPLSQQAGEIQDLVCYNHYGVASKDHPEHCHQLGQDMADKWLMIMHNHGLLAAGRTVGEAFYFLYMLETSCKIQTDVMSSEVDYHLPDAASVSELAKTTAPSGDQPCNDVNITWQAMIRLQNRLDPSYKN